MLSDSEKYENEFYYIDDEIVELCYIHPTIEYSQILENVDLHSIIYDSSEQLDFENLWAKDIKNEPFFQDIKEEPDSDEFNESFQMVDENFHGIKEKPNLNQFSESFRTVNENFHSEVNEAFKTEGESEKCGEDPLKIKQEDIDDEVNMETSFTSLNNIIKCERDGVKIKSRKNKSNRSSCLDFEGVSVERDSVKKKRNKQKERKLTKWRMRDKQATTENKSYRYYLRPRNNLSSKRVLEKQNGRAANAVTNGVVNKLMKRNNTKKGERKVSKVKETLTKRKRSRDICYKMRSKGVRLSVNNITKKHKSKENRKNNRVEILSSNDVELVKSERGKKYSCSACKYSSIQKSMVLLHIRRHLNHKPFKCIICDYASVEKSHLDRHMKIHTGERPHKCLYCEYSSIQRLSLRKHLLKCPYKMAEHY